MNSRQPPPGHGIRRSLRAFAAGVVLVLLAGCQADPSNAGCAFSALVAQPGTPLFAEVRGKRLPVTVAEMPFVTPHYKRR